MYCEGIEVCMHVCARTCTQTHVLQWIWAWKAPNGSGIKRMMSCLWWRLCVPLPIIHFSPSCPFQQKEERITKQKKDKKYFSSLLCYRNVTVITRFLFGFLFNWVGSQEKLNIHFKETHKWHHNWTQQKKCNSILVLVLYIVDLNGLPHIPCIAAEENLKRRTFVIATKSPCTITCISI